MKRHLSCFLLTTGMVIFAGISPAQLEASGPWNGHAVAFTFSSDDGDRTGNLAWANVFKPRALSYTIFIPSTWVGMTGTKLTANDLRNLNNQGFEIGSHGRTHARLTDIDDAQLIDELIGSCRDLETIMQDPNYHCRTIAYPEHAHDLHVMAVAESLGFTAARDGGTSSAGYPNFSLGQATWSETSLFEVPLTVVSAYLVGTGNAYSEAMTRAKVDTLIGLTTPHNVWINVYAHTVSDIDAQHMTWILDELGQQDVWVANFATIADFYRVGHSLVVPVGVGDKVPVLLSRFTAASRQDGILLQWTASGDLEFAGINVERSVEDKTGYARLNAALLPPTASGRYLDASAKPGMTYYYRLQVVSRTGTSTYFGPIMAGLKSEQLKPEPTLGLAAPNPSRNGRSTIAFSLPQSSEVTLRILNLTGRNVKTLVSEAMDPGEHAVSWNGRDDHGETVPSGLYLYQLEALGSAATRKLFWIQ